MVKSRAYSRVVSSLWPVVAVATMVLTACSGAVVGPPLVGDGREARIADLDVVLMVPVGFDQKKASVWTLDSAGSRHAMLWVQHKELSGKSVESVVNEVTEALGRGGKAGVTRREKIMLDDLEAHFVEAVTVVGAQRSAAMQVTVGAEDGMYVVSLLATVDAMRRNHKAFEACVKSLRIPAR